MHLFFYLIWGELTLIGREKLLEGGIETTLDLKKTSFKLVSFFELVPRRGIEDTA